MNAFHQITSHHASSSQVEIYKICTKLKEKRQEGNLLCRLDVSLFIDEKGTKFKPSSSFTEGEGPQNQLCKSQATKKYQAIRQKAQQQIRKMNTFSCPSCWLVPREVKARCEA